MDDPPQVMAPHSLHNGMAVHARGESGPYTDDHRRVGNFRPQVLLRQDGVHHCVRLQCRDAGPLRVRQHRDTPGFQNVQRRFRRRRLLRGHILHDSLPVNNGLGKANRPPDGGGPLDIGHDHPDMGPPKPQGNAGGQITGSPNHYEHVKYSLLWRLPASTGQSSRAARASAAAKSCRVST